MKKIVIIGAGAMGSAFAVPCADNSNEVFLVGSFLEDKVIDEIKNLHNFHPILKSQLPKNIKVLKFSEFQDEIKDNIDLLVVGVSSKGIEWIGNEISKFYKSSMDILLLTKGLAVINNQFETLAEKLNKILKEKGINDSKISAVGGPCLANGLANRINSSVVLANENLDIVPHFLISLLLVSSFPIGTSSRARLGNEDKMFSILILYSLCNLSICSTSLDISFDLENLFLSLFLDIIFFSCSSFSFFCINSLFLTSRFNKAFKSILIFLLFIFSKNKFGLSLINFILCIFFFLYKLYRQYR